MGDFGGVDREKERRFVNDVVVAATHKYLMDPIHHALVENTVRVLRLAGEDLKSDAALEELRLAGTGLYSDSEDHLVRAAASVALELATRNPMTGIPVEDT